MHIGRRDNGIGWLTSSEIRVALVEGDRDIGRVVRSCLNHVVAKRPYAIVALDHAADVSDDVECIVFTGDRADADTLSAWAAATRGLVPFVIVGDRVDAAVVSAGDVMIHVEIPVSSASPVLLDEAISGSVVRHAPVRQAIHLNEMLRVESSRLADLVGLIGHDLLNPLTALKGMTALLGNEQIGEQDRRAMAGRLEPLVDRVIDALDGLVGSVRQGHDPVAVSIADTVQFAARLVGLDDEVTCSIEATTVTIEATEFRHLIVNLLANASKYRSPDRPLAIEVSADHVGDAVVIIVADNGLGIPVSERSRVLEPGARVVAADRADVDGTGFGLAACRRVATRAGGSLRVCDSPLGGVALEVRLPAESIASAERQAAGPASA